MKTTDELVNLLYEEYMNNDSRHDTVTALREKDRRIAALTEQRDTLAEALSLVWTDYGPLLGTAARDAVRTTLEEADAAPSGFVSIGALSGGAAFEGQSADEFLRKRVAEIAPGEKKWTVPWAVRVTQDGSAYIDTTFFTYDEPGGTVELGVVRSETGYTIEIPLEFDFKWSPAPLSEVFLHRMAPVEEIVF